MNDRTSQRRASLAYPWFVVAVLMITYVLSFVDRQILSLLVGPLRRDLEIGDTAMSLLMGLSFAVFYTVMGIPLGRLADTHSRKGLIVSGLLVWSLMTAMCGVARNYWQMFLCRIGVGVGEAALSPAAYSMIADYFPPERRATAISVYSMGIYLGSGLAMLLGGLVVQFVSGQEEILLPILGATRPWQMVFLILGAAGLLFSLAYLTVREPPRVGTEPDGPPFGEVLRYLASNKRAMLCHNFGFAAIAFCSYGATAWVPTYFIRTHGLSAGDVGVVYGLMAMFLGSLGVVLGGRLADYWVHRGHQDGALRVGMLSCGLLLVGNAAFLLMPDATTAFVALSVPALAFAMPFGAAAAAIQDIVPPRMRGQASALYLLIISLVGLGLGPTAVALVTEYVFADDQALRWSLLITSTAALSLALVLLQAGRSPYRKTMARLQTIETPA